MIRVARGILLPLLLFLCGVCGPQTAFAAGWEKLPGAAVDVAAGSGGNVWVAGTDSRGYVWNAKKNDWDQRAESNLTNLDLGPDGKPWFVLKGGTVWDVKVVNAPKAQDIGIGLDGSIFITGTDDSIQRLNKATGAWEKFPGAAEKIDVTPEGNPVVVNAANQIYFWKPSSKSWVRIPGAAHDIAVSGSNVLVIGTGRGELCRRPSDPDFKGEWVEELPDPGVQFRRLAAAPDGSVYAVGVDKSIWHYSADLPPFKGGKTIRLKQPGGKYYSVFHKDWELKADCDKPGVWETFTITSIENSPTKVCLQTADGKFLSRRFEFPERPIRGGVPHLAAWEKFEGSLQKGDENLILLASVEAGKRSEDVFAYEIVPPLAKPALETFPAAGGLTCAYVKDYDKVWCSKKQGPATVITVGRPKLPEGWVFLGDVAGVGEKLPTNPSLILQDHPDLLAKPVEFRWVWGDWRDKHPAGVESLGMWYPVPPPGYVSLGCVITKTGVTAPEVPEIAKLRCVRADAAMTGDWGPEIWNSDAAGTKINVGLIGVQAPPEDRRKWDSTMGNAPAVLPGTFKGIPRDSHTAYLVHGRKRGGNYFKDFGPPGTVLSNLIVRSGWWIDGVKAVFKYPNDPKSPEFIALPRGGGGGGEAKTPQKPGYAIGNMWMCEGDIIDHLVVVYMKLENGKYNIKDRYGDAGNSGCRFDSGRGDGDWRFWRPDKEDGDLIAGIRGFCGEMIDGLGVVEVSAIPYVIKGLSVDQMKAEFQARALAERKLLEGDLVREKVAKELKNKNLAPVQANATPMIQEVKQDLEEAKASAEDLPKAGPKAKDELVASAPVVPTAVPLPKRTPTEFDTAVKNLAKTASSSLRIGLVPGFENVAFLKDVQVASGTVTSGDKPCPWVCLTGEAAIKDFPQFEVMGTRTAKCFAFSRNSPDGLQAAFLFSPGTEALGKIGIMSSEPLKTLAKNLILTYAPKAHVCDVKDLPAPIQNELKAQTVIESGKILFEETSGFMFGCKPQDVPGLRDVLKTFLNSVETMMVSGTRPKVPTDSMRLRGSFQSGFNSKVFPPGFAIHDAEIEFNGLQIGLLGKAEIKLSDSIHLKNLGLRIDFPKLSGAAFDNVTISVMIPGEWKNPLGIKGLVLKGLILSGQFGKSPGIGIRGTIDFGRTLEVAGAMSFTSPVAVSALSGKIDQLSLKDVITGVNSLLRQGAGALKLPDPGSVDIPCDIIRLNDVELTIALAANPAFRLQEGLTLRGKTNIAGADIGNMDIRVVPDKGFYAKASITKFSLGPLQLTGAGPDAKPGTPDDCPYLDIEVFIDMNAKPIPVFTSHAFLTGQINLAGVFLDLLVKMSRTSYSVTLAGYLPGGIGIGLEGSGPIQAGFALGTIAGANLSGFVELPGLGKLNANVMDEVKKIPGAKEVLGFISGTIFGLKEISLTASITELAKGTIPGVKVTCTVVGSDVSFSIPNVPAKDFGVWIADKCKNEVWNAIKSLGLDIGKFFEDVGKETANFAKDRANETAAVAVQAGNTIKDAGIVIGKTFENLGKTVGEESVRLGRDIGNGFIFVGGHVKTGINKAGNWIKDNLNPFNW